MRLNEDFFGKSPRDRLFARFVYEGAGEVGENPITTGCRNPRSRGLILAEINISESDDGS